MGIGVDVLGSADGEVLGGVDVEVESGADAEVLGGVGSEVEGGAVVDPVIGAVVKVVDDTGLVAGTEDSNAKKTPTKQIETMIKKTKP